MMKMKSRSDLTPGAIVEPSGKGIVAGLKAGRRGVVLECIGEYVLVRIGNAKPKYYPEDYWRRVVQSL